MEKCLFCKSDCNSKSEIRTSGSTYSPMLSVRCPTCGDYIFSEKLIDEISNRSKKMSPQSKVNCSNRCLNIKKIGYGSDGLKPYPFWTKREEYETLKLTKCSNEVLIIIDDAETEFVDHSEKPFKLLEILSSKLNQDSAFKAIKPTPEDLIEAKTPSEELETILHFLFKKGWIGNGKLTQTPTDQFSEIRSTQTFCLTIEGWEIIRERFSGTNSKKVFIAMKFEWPDGGLEASVVRAIKRACEKHGFEADTVTEYHTGYITDRIISDIKRSKFVVADFTFNNPGVYFEAGFAKGIGKNVFHIINEDYINGNETEGKKLHFDIKQVMYKTWKNPEEVYKKLDEWIGATINQKSGV